MFNRETSWGSEVELFYQDDDIKGEIEYHSGMAFIHVEFTKGKISSMKAILKYHFPAILNYLREKGYTKCYSYSRNTKFVDKLPGAKRLTYFIAPGNQRYEVWEWVLQP